MIIMPELPEVETTCRGIAQLLVSKIVEGGTVYNRRLRYTVQSDLIEKLTGQTLLDIQRRAKYIIMKFSKGALIIHLGMSGSLRVLDAVQKRRKHDHIEILFNKLLLRYHDPRRFGAFVWTESDPLKHKMLRDLGVEPLAKKFTGQFLYEETRKTRSAIKNVLMNNRLVVGVGNIYANEALFRAGIHPKRPAYNISKKRYQVLVNQIKNVLSQSIRDGGTTLRDFYKNDGEPGYFKTKLKIYGRKGLPCERCGQKVRVLVIAQRTSYYCVRCQT